MIISPRSVQLHDSYTTYVYNIHNNNYTLSVRRNIRVVPSEGTFIYLFI